jgi:hypothetical protein
MLFISVVARTIVPRVLKWGFVQEALRNGTEQAKLQREWQSARMLNISGPATATVAMEELRQIGGQMGEEL